jgi:4-hydroxy-3-methylbut-2-en-1-yl diphosphate synthase IspG/GcpE
VFWVPFVSVHYNCMHLLNTFVYSCCNTYKSLRVGIEKGSVYSVLLHSYKQCIRVLVKGVL